MPVIVDEPEPKRRKIRKGTRSCWECKGRKVKCTYLTATDAVCEGCLRRGTDCIGQELPEQPVASIDRRQQMASRLVRVEALVQNLTKKSEDGLLPMPRTVVSKSNEDSSSDLTDQTPSTAGTLQNTSPQDTLAHETSRTIPEVFNSPVLENTSAALLALFPSQENVDTIVRKAGPMASFFHQLVRKPYKDLQISEQGRLEAMTELTIRHTSKTHPLIIARQMLLLAITIRYFHPNMYQQLEGFSDTPDVLIRRLGEAAVDFITKNDEMTDTLERLECLLLTCTFQVDNGNLLSGWKTVRRAIVDAQLMHLQRQNHPPLKTILSEDRWDPQYLWYRIVYYDRFFSLILGLPQGSVDTSMGVAPGLADDLPMGYLERQHCVLACKILQRNEQDPDFGDFKDTKAIDMELRRLSESMPSKWWLVPNLASISDEVHLFWETTKLMNQVFHYILLSHLYLPFLFRPSSEPQQDDQYEYGRLSCINASRDLLSRYRVFRTLNDISYCCHSMDFYAITASMTLLLAHLDGYRSKRLSDIASVHHRMSDRAIMEEILDNMEQVGTLDKVKTLNEKGAGVLRQLLVIESNAALGSRYQLERGDGNQPFDPHSLRLSIPYFGLVTITREKDGSKDEASAMVVHQQQQERVRGGGVSGSTGSESQIVDGFESSTRGSVVRSLPENHTEAVPQEDENVWSFQGGDIIGFETFVEEMERQEQDCGEFWWLQ